MSISCKCPICSVHEFNAVPVVNHSALKCSMCEENTKVMLRFRCGRISCLQCVFFVAKLFLTGTEDINNQTDNKQSQDN